MASSGYFNDEIVSFYFLFLILCFLLSTEETRVCIFHLPLTVRQDLIRKLVSLYSPRQGMLVR